MHPTSYAIQSIACGTMAPVLAWHRAGSPDRILGGSLQSYGLYALAVFVCEGTSSTMESDVHIHVLGGILMRMSRRPIRRKSKRARER